MPIFKHRTGILDLSGRTAVMGILNITPDSFSDGGKYIDPDTAAAHAVCMAEDGADLIDIGAQSTRPGHIPVTAEQEWRRLEPVLKALKNQINIPVSVDTYYPEVAAAAIRAGVSIINDVSGNMQNSMLEVAANTGAGLVMMHSGRGADDTGNSAHTVETVRDFFEYAVGSAFSAGLQPEQICLDPGIGFGKDRQGDLELIARLPELLCGLPRTVVLVGASRKRVIAACCNTVTSPGERLAGTLALHAVAQWNGANILRVHDVAAAVQAARVADALIQCKG